MNSRIATWLCAAALVLLCSHLSTARAGVITNGEFTDPLSTGWNTAVFTPPTYDATNEWAVFTTSGDVTVQLDQVFTLPALANTLSFDYLFAPAVQGMASNGPFDNFQATLVSDPGNDPLAPFNPPVFTAFFNTDAFGILDAHDSVTITDLAGGWKRVRLPVSSFAPQQVRIDFLHQSFAADNYDTVVLLDNVKVDVIPEPTSMAIWGVLGVTATVRLRRKRKQHLVCDRG